MHNEVLTDKQKGLLPILKDVSGEFGLVGGTAIALHLGHRESIDFDLFKNGGLDILKLKKAVNKLFPIQQVRIENVDEYTLRTNDVQLTFYNYPFAIPYDVPFDDVIRVPSLLTLATMKVFALGKRAKWKDYVDLYFILQKHSFGEIVKQSEQIFKGEFSEKLLREQLSYHADIDYTEEVVYKDGYFVDTDEIKKKLIDISIS